MNNQAIEKQRAKNGVVYERAVIIRRRTLLEEYVSRFNTRLQAKFYLEHAGTDFASVAAAHDQYHEALNVIQHILPRDLKSHVIERDFLPQYSFEDSDLVITIGPDGLVVNTAKYLDSQPIMAINPDPASIDGILLPFNAFTANRYMASVLNGESTLRKVTMARAETNDGQRLLAFNDLFVGANSHVSAHYQISHGDITEHHSSSGIIISTGAGSTGWLKSVYTGAAGVIRALGGNVNPPENSGRLAWDEDKLIFSVREPFPSKTSGTNLIYGVITRDKPLILSSTMGNNGVIFSDGVEQDYIHFNAGAISTISIADQKARLLFPD
ncbi:MAG: sugar kinase [Gammaproteobacteria bacterium]|nr:MAG: sugar kinase [Gammaproteobacteria bacterium]